MPQIMFPSFHTHTFYVTIHAVLLNGKHSDNGITHTFAISVADAIHVQPECKNKHDQAVTPGFDKVIE
jgi:hypothetical protein